MHTFPALLLVVAALSGEATAARSPGVVVEYDSPYLTVRTSQPITLRAVIGEVCRVTQARCEWDEKALQALEAETVPGMVLRGTWTEILSQLLAGTNLNYATLEPSDRQSGRLLVEYRAPTVATRASASGLAGDKERELSSETPSSASDPVTMQPGAEGAVGSEGYQDDPASEQSGGEVESPESSETSSSSGSSGAGVGGGGDVARPEAVTFMDRPITRPIYPFVSPFPDEMGNPVPVSEQAIKGSPFPDPQGAPVQVLPADEGRPHGSPFPP
jgi:hypothetical protein